MADGQAVHLLVGVVSQLAENRRQGQVQPDASGQEPCGVCPAFGGLEPDAEQELPGCVPASAAFAAGGAQGSDGIGAQAATDCVPSGALRNGVCEANGGGLR